MKLLDRLRDRPGPTVVVEPMRHRHVAAALEIERTAYPKPWSERVFHAELDQVRDGTRCYLIARRGRAVVGYAGLTHSSRSARAWASCTSCAADGWATSETSQW